MSQTRRASSGRDIEVRDEATDSVGGVEAEDSNIIALRSRKVYVSPARLKDDVAGSSTSGMMQNDPHLLFSG